MLFRLAVLALFVGLSANSVMADIHDIDKLLRDLKFKKIASELAQLSPREKNHSTALYARAITTTQGKAAYSLYNEIVQKDHTSKYADHALFRIAQYHYLTKNYNVAKGYFSLLSRHYNDSNLKDDAQYMYCQSLMAQGAVDSAKLFLRTFVKNVKRSPFVDLAILDLEDLENDAGLTSQDIGALRYSIQVGAFSERNNARRFAETLGKRSIPADIVEKRIGRRRLWAVWVGRFASRESAKAYANSNLAKIIEDYQIVDRKDNQ